MCDESVRVIARCRPLDENEIKMKTEIIVSMDASLRQCTLHKPADAAKSRKIFTFDGVYGSKCTTEKIYSGIVHPIVDGVLEGYNGTVFAYGQTSCGKTFTMQGSKKPENLAGIIPRCCKHILSNIHGKGLRENREYLLRVSYLEIYNEEIRDLLVKNSRYKLEIKEHPDKGMYVKGLSSITVDCYDDMEEILEIGSANRSVGATCMNTDSSRSHSIFIIDLEMRVHQQDDGKEFYRNGKMNLVDLAGSERQSKSGATGERFREATRINLSLSALGNVISALVDGKSKHIPYRDSKLTRILQDSLGGNSKTLMVACISPGANNYEETLSTLRYAKRAKSIRNRPRINEDPKDSLIRKYLEEIQQLKKIISKKVEIPTHLALEISGKQRRPSGRQSPSSPKQRENVNTTTTTTTTTTTFEVEEYQEDLLQTEILHTKVCQETKCLVEQVENLKTQLKVQRRIEYEARKTVVEEYEKELTLIKTRREADGACLPAISHAAATCTPRDQGEKLVAEVERKSIGTSTDDLQCSETESDLHTSEDDGFPDTWSIRENLLCREEADGRSRSASPYTGELLKEKARFNLEPVKKTFLLDDEGPVTVGLCSLCPGVSFFGERFFFLTKNGL